MHDARKKRTGTTDARPVSPPRLCSVGGCGGLHWGLGYCRKHHNWFVTYGSVEPPSSRCLPFKERILRLIDMADDNGCWLWVGRKTNGYGIQYDSNKRRMRQAHRIVWDMFVGDLEEDLQLDHICRNRACVNPLHLRKVTNQQNSENRGMVERSGRPRGVFLDKRPRSASKPWYCRVTYCGKSYSGGYHKTMEEAAAAILSLRLSLLTHNDQDRIETRKAS